ncbi:MAG: 50S ribosomal protein L23 [Candidatus Omnitrophica bacterium]|nr:50S ribosomal protein L23 [Candidatus Omnitrophota bacterium]MBU1656989.1 50S ribosomal protein L23 [Candidatus Omnitrophota bacterium]MBU1784267.1 50S ribosomal protein L23 [Candidatus Omnitrophota bacterium]MBU1851825.1 50S ribosomal protein L23 [Candidatus Omnitrophota bacterium]
MRTPHDVIKNMVRTEKGSNLLIQNKYFFKVSQDANKIDIKRSVESIYKVHVKSVNIISVKGKKRRVRLHQGMTSAWKKAIVTLKPESKIEVT